MRRPAPCCVAEAIGATAAPEAWANKVARMLLDQGADKLLGR